MRYEEAEARFRSGREMLNAGDHVGFSRMPYTRVFFPDAMADLQARCRRENERLGLPLEDLDEQVKAAIDMFAS